VDELATLLALERDVVVIDTRGHSAYAAAHIPGALDIPASQVGDAAPQLARSAKVVLYCS
jgi:rhodanese-related sulfurtransferase